MSAQVNFMISDALTSLLTLNSGILAVSLGLLSYVLTALGLYTIAKRRGIHKPWLSWIPVVNVWVLGSISDQYRYVVRGQNTGKRKILLVTSLVMCVMYVAILCLVVAAFGYAIFGGSARVVYRLIRWIWVLCAPLVGVAIARAVIYYMALYDVYMSCEPKNGVMYLVLSIFFSITRPFFLFFSREKDGGMPPRRDRAAQTSPEPIPGPEQSADAEQSTQSEQPTEPEQPAEPPAGQEQSE